MFSPSVRGLQIVTHCPGTGTFPPALVSSRTQCKLSSQEGDSRRIHQVALSALSKYQNIPAAGMWG